MALQLRLKVRDWDFWTPLLLGDVKSEKLDIQTTRVSSLIDNVAEDPESDAAEMSLSRYNLRIDQNKAQGIVAVPFFIMRGFRTRNIVTIRATPGPGRSCAAPASTATKSTGCSRAARPKTR